MQHVKRGVRGGGRDRINAKKSIRQQRRAPRDYSKYTHRLSLFTHPPIDEVSLEEFELFAVDRLRALKCIETAKVRWPKRGEEYDKAIRVALRDNIPLSTNVDAETAYDERRKDHVSHYILRLAYCKSEDLRRWFLTNECDMFRYRFDQEDGDSVNTFLTLNNLSYAPISHSDKESRAQKLASCGYTNNIDKVMRTDYYQVAFEEAGELVKSRRVYVEGGFAYVPKGDIISIIVGAFRAKLSAALTATSKALPSLEEDTRLLPMLTNLSKQYLGSDYGNSGNKAIETITAAAVHQLAPESFPLCMRHSHDHLMQHHHLKHGARMQYGLFLKGIGLTLEEALLFWRSEFGKSMSMDKFEKNHAYNIRHNYGKEGKRTDYTPYSCMKIIMSNPPGTGDAHGCPFRHFDQGELRLRLMSYKVPPKGISEIMKLVSDQHYQLACVRYFEVTHGDDLHGAMALQHPNQYFQKSREVRTGDKMDVEGVKKEAAPGPAASTAAPAAAAPSPAKMDTDGHNSDDDLMAAMDAME